MRVKEVTRTVKCEMCDATAPDGYKWPGQTHNHPMLVLSTWNTEKEKRDYLDFCSKRCLQAWLTTAHVAAAHAPGTTRHLWVGPSWWAKELSEKIGLGSNPKMVRKASDLIGAGKNHTIHLMMMSRWEDLFGAEYEGIKTELQRLLATKVATILHHR